MTLTPDRQSSEPLPLQRFAATLPGVSLSKIKLDLGRLNFLRRTSVRTAWKVRKSTAKHLFEERVWARTGKIEIFPTEAGKAKLRELYEAGELTLRYGRKLPEGGVLKSEPTPE